MRSGTAVGGTAHAAATKEGLLGSGSVKFPALQSDERGPPWSRVGRTISATLNLMKSPELIYHYTDASALISIIGNAMLRASDALYLNDERELRAGNDAFVRAARQPHNLKKIERSEGLGSIRKSIVAAILNVPEKVDLVGPLEPNAPRVYVACFCKHRDLLSQWRSYGHGGYAIGFDRVLLGHNANPMGMARVADERTAGRLNTDLVQVVYQDHEADALIEEADPFGGATAFSVNSHERASALKAPASIKDRGFSEEKDWRLIDIKPDPSAEPEEHYRSAVGSVVPYIELAFPRPAVREIVVGPGGDSRLRVGAIKRLLER